MAYDPNRLDACKWRIYKKETGTWHPCSTAGEARLFIRQVLVESLEVLADMALSVQKTLPSHSMARKEAAILNETLRTNCVRLSGALAYMSALATAVEVHCIVPREKWKSHLSGYLPVANALLQFSTTTGEVVGLPYQPDMFICHENQAPLDWDASRSLANEGLEALLNSWWDKEDRKAWLQFIAYGLSRTAFAEKLFVLYGPPGSAKSSLFKLLGEWFQATNVFSMRPFWCRQTSQTSTTTMAVDMTVPDWPCVTRPSSFCQRPPLVAIFAIQWSRVSRVQFHSAPNEP